MEIQPTNIPEVVIIKPAIYRDSRGFFMESYNQQTYANGGICADFVQDNHSHSSKGILRGLHAQLIKPQAKLVRVVQGEVLDVAVDIRKGSPTFAHYAAVRLSEENALQLFIPRGFLHGFVVLSETADFQYKCDNYYEPSGELTVRWDDPDIGIDWPINNPVISDKDAAGKSLQEVMDKLPIYEKTPDN